MNRPITLAIAIRTGAMLAVVANALAELTRGGQAIALVTDDGDETTRALIEQLRGRHGRVVVAGPAGIDGLPPEDQLEAYGLTHLIPQEDAADPDVGEVCESGASDCGPVEFHDSEGVPLCRRCYDDLEPADPDAIDEGSSGDAGDTTAEAAQPEAPATDIAAELVHMGELATDDTTSPGE